MKFQFCGGRDAPDWILMEVVKSLSRISSVRVKLLCNQCIHAHLGREIQYDKIKRLTEDIDFFTPSEVKSTVASLAFILKNAAKYDVEPAILSEELQQLGLPKESSEAIRRAFGRNKDNLIEAFRNHSLSLPSVQNLDWTVDFVMTSNFLPNVNNSLVRLDVETDGGENVPLNFTSEQFSVFCNELRTIRSLLKQR